LHSPRRRSPGRDGTGTGTTADANTSPTPASRVAELGEHIDATLRIHEPAVEQPTTATAEKFRIPFADIDIPKAETDIASINIQIGELGNQIRQEFDPPAGWGHILGKELNMRLAMTLALAADVVVGTESAIVNAVASAPNLKIVLLSHSTPENLTKHWVNTMSVEPVGLGCYPCHRLHRGFEFCNQDPDTKWSACQSKATAEAIVNAAHAVCPYSNAVKGNIDVALTVTTH
jgi:hypothetical protein